MELGVIAERFDELLVQTLVLISHADIVPLSTAVGFVDVLFFLYNG